MLEPHFAGAVVSAVAILIAVAQLCRVAQLAMFHRTLRKALDAGVTIDAAQLDRALGHRPARERAFIEARNGCVLVAIALATGGYGAVAGTPEWIRLALGAALFPLFAGLTLIAFSRRVGRGD
jgi:hypothetical protein